MTVRHFQKYQENFQIFQHKLFNEYLLADCGLAEWIMNTPPLVVS